MIISDMLYKCNVMVDGSCQSIEIMDTCTSVHHRDLSDGQVNWADAFVIVYSVSDRGSFIWASDLIQVC